MKKSTDKHDTTALSNELVTNLVKTIKANDKCIECCFIDMVVTMMINLLIHITKKDGADDITLDDLLALSTFLIKSCQATIKDGNLELHQVELNQQQTH